MHCPECGTSIPYAAARFCSECGQKLFLVSIEDDTKAAEATTDSNQTSVAGNVKTGGGDFVGRDHHEGKSFVFHLAQPGVYKVILSATLSVLFVFLLVRTLILVQQISNTPLPGTVTVHSGVLTTATAEADKGEDARATAAALETALIEAQATVQLVQTEVAQEATRLVANETAITEARATARVATARASNALAPTKVTVEPERATAAAVAAHDLTAQVTQTVQAAAAQAAAQATIVVELTLGAEARATLAVLQAPIETPTPTWTPTPTP